MIFLVVAAVFAVLILIYALALRPWLKAQPWAQGFFARIDTVELALFKKSETILVGRLLWVGSFMVSIYDGLAQFVKSLDLTPLTTRIMDGLQIPQDMRGLAVSAFLTGIGLTINYLRTNTSRPLELVAVADKDVTPRIAEAIAMADATKTEAVSVVAEAKAA